MAKLDENGHEVLDDTPMELPVGFKHPPSLEDRIKMLIRGHLSAHAASRGAETFEEADDFDVEEDPVDYSSPWETCFDPDLGKDITRAEKQFLDQERAQFDKAVRAKQAKDKAAKAAKKTETVTPGGEQS